MSAELRKFDSNRSINYSQLTLQSWTFCIENRKSSKCVIQYCRWLSDPYLISLTQYHFHDNCGDAEDSLVSSNNDWLTNIPLLPRWPLGRVLNSRFSYIEHGKLIQLYIMFKTILNYSILAIKHVFSSKKICSWLKDKRSIGR